MKRLMPFSYLDAKFRATASTGYLSFAKALKTGSHKASFTCGEYEMALWLSLGTVILGRVWKGCGVVSVS